MTSLYLAEKDMHSRMKDSLDAMERKNLRKQVQNDLERQSGGFLTTTLRGWAQRLSQTAQSLRAWFASPPVVKRPR